LRGARPRARERGGTARRTRAKTSIASRIPETVRGVARAFSARDARWVRATLSRGETRRSEKFAWRETARARTRRDRATDARENVNRVAHPGDGSRRRARVFGSRRAVSGARGVLRGETRRSEKFESRDTQRAGRGARIARRASIEAPSVVLVFKVS